MNIESESKLHRYDPEDVHNADAREALNIAVELVGAIGVNIQSNYGPQSGWEVQATFAAAEILKSVAKHLGKISSEQPFIYGQEPKS
jgi:hypothetical protein